MAASRFLDSVLRTLLGLGLWGEIEEAPLNIPENSNRPLLHSPRPAPSGGGAEKVFSCVLKGPLRLYPAIFACFSPRAREVRRARRSPKTPLSQETTSSFFSESAHQAASSLATCVCQAVTELPSQTYPKHASFLLLHVSASSHLACHVPRQGAKGAQPLQLHTATDVRISCLC